MTVPRIGWWRRLRAWLLGASWLLWLASAAAAVQSEDSLERLEVHVTAVSGRSIFLDRGSADGLQPGLLVRLFPLRGPMVEATVRVVSKGSARVDVEAGVLRVRVGDRGEVLLPVPAEDAGIANDVEREVPEHPPWEQGSEPWDAEVPLLAPMARTKPEERDTRIRGRFFTLINRTEDQEGGKSRYSSFRLGADVTGENLFGWGGATHFDGELFRRDVNTDDGEDETYGRFRVDRLSYRLGGGSERPTRWEFGRFLQHEFPELGLLDGVEVVHRLTSGSRLGASTGLMPANDDELGTGDDVQAALFYRWVSDLDETHSLGLAYQKTWHRGEADRDLVVATADLHPTDRLWLYGAAWIDAYGAGDEIKDDGLELSQLQLHGRYRLDDRTGFGLFLSDLRWPELLRDEFDPLTAEQLADNHVTRYGVDAWRQVNRTVRIDGRFDQWEDQEDSGSNMALNLTLQDLAWERGSVGIGVYDSQGAFSSGLGWRLSADRRFDAGLLRASWDVTDLDQEDFIGNQEQLQQQILRVGYDASFGAGWDVSLFGERRFGDEQDATSMGLQVGRRF